MTLDLTAMTKSSLMVFALLVAGQAQAQAPYPTKTVRIVTVLPAGPDGYVRTFASRLTEQMGQPVVVDNRPGAGGVIAAQSVTQAPPDGHSLMVIAAAFVIAKAVNPKLAYEPLEDFVGIAKIYGGSSSMLLVRPESPANTLAQLLDLARASPGKFSFGVGGIGGQPHLSAAALMTVSGIKALHVPFKTQGDVALALLRGDVDFTILATTTSLAQAQSGKFRVLAVTSGNRIKQFPDVPTVHEVTKNELLIHETWAGLASHAKLPADLVRRLHAETQKALADPLMKKSLEAGGNEPTVNESVEQFSTFLRREDRKWRDIVKLTGVKPEQ